MAQTLNDLALLSYQQGQYEQALPLYQRALAILKHTLPDHPTTATTQKQLAALARRMERAEMASG